MTIQENSCQKQFLNIFDWDKGLCKLIQIWLTVKSEVRGRGGHNATILDFKKRAHHLRQPAACLVAQGNDDYDHFLLNISQCCFGIIMVTVTINITVREAPHLQNGWIFGKNPNGLSPSLPPSIFGKSYCGYYVPFIMAKICNINFWTIGTFLKIHLFW